MHNQDKWTMEIGEIDGMMQIEKEFPISAGKDSRYGFGDSGKSGERKSLYEKRRQYHENKEKKSYLGGSGIGSHVWNHGCGGGTVYLE